MTTITAKVIAHSTAGHGIDIVSVECRYPRCIHSELMTHRVFSRNAASSRAIPTHKLIEDVERDPFIPLFWGADERGMQSTKECNNQVDVGWFFENPQAIRDGNPRGFEWRSEMRDREKAWRNACNSAVKYAKAFANAGYHKQIVNRLLEPFAHITTLITATQWSNFFALRRHHAAEPHIQLLADRIWEAIQASTPKHLKIGEWHLPYTDDLIADTTAGDAVEVSVARCASTSYKTVDGKEMSIERAHQLCDKLLSHDPIHASPAEHQATPDQKVYSPTTRLYSWQQPELHGNFAGWIQYRKTLVGECK